MRISFRRRKKLKKSIAEILESEGMISHELAVTDYRAELHCMGDKT